MNNFYHSMRDKKQETLDTESDMDDKLEELIRIARENNTLLRAILIKLNDSEQTDFVQNVGANLLANKIEKKMSTEVILALIGTASAGIAGLWKAIQWAIEKLDERYQKQLEERNAERDKITEKLEKLEKDVAQEREVSQKEKQRIISIILDCETKSCETKKKLAEYLKEKDVA